MRSIAQALIMATMLLPVAADRAAAQATAQASATVTLTIEQYLKVIVDPEGIGEWGQGHLADGTPNYDLDGAAPDFAGGGWGDVWKVPRPPDASEGGPNVGGQRRFADGAVGRCRLWTQGNVTAKVQVLNADVDMVLVQERGERFEIPVCAWIGWDTPQGVWIYGERENLPAGEHEMWLYATARRLGLRDEWGTYTGTVVVTIMATP